MTVPSSSHLGSWDLVSIFPFPSSLHYPSLFFLSLLIDFPLYLPHYSTSLQLLSCRYVSLSPLFHLPSRSLPPLLHLKVLLGRYPIGLIYLCLIRLGLITPLLFFVYAVLKPPCGCFMWCELSLFPFFCLHATTHPFSHFDCSF